MANLPLGGRELLLALMAALLVVRDPDSPAGWLLLLLVAFFARRVFAARRVPPTRTDALAKRLDAAVRAVDRKAYVQWVGDRAYLYLDRRFLTAANVDAADPAPVEAAFVTAVQAARSRAVAH